MSVPQASAPLRPVDAHVHGVVDRERILALRSVHLHEASAAIASDTGPLCTGLHPWNVQATSWKSDVSQLEHLLSTGRFLALGEAGLDRSRPPDVFLQTDALLAQIELSERFALPLVVHCVRSASDLLAMRVRCAALQPWIIHGWNGSRAQTADLLRKTDFVFSFGAALLCPESKARESLPIVPDDRILLETDTSNLAIEMIEREAALLRKITAETLRERLHSTWKRLFEG